MVVKWRRWGYLGTQAHSAGTSRGWVLQGLEGGCESPCNTVLDQYMNTIPTETKSNEVNEKDWFVGVENHDRHGRTPVQQNEGGFSIVLYTGAYEEVVHNVLVFSKLGLIGRFSGLWPSLSELHKWISENWGPLLTRTV